MPTCGKARCRAQAVRLRKARWWVWTKRRSGLFALYKGNRMVVRVDGSGYRLWINGNRRTFYDTVLQACTASFGLVDKGLANAPKTNYASSLSSLDAKGRTQNRCGSCQHRRASHPYGKRCLARRCKCRHYKDSHKAANDTEERHAA